MALQPKEFNIPPGGLKTTLKVSPAAWEPRVLFCWLLSLGLAPAGALGMPPSSLQDSPAGFASSHRQTVCTARQAGAEWLVSG